MNEPYTHDPRIAAIDAELEKLESQRLAIKDRGRALMAEKTGLMMHEQVTLRVLNDSPLSAAELAWTEANPEAWAKIKEATKGKRGSRQAQRVSAQ